MFRNTRDRVEWERARPPWWSGLDIELHIGVLGRPRASFEVLLGLKSEYCQRLASACRRGSFCAAVAAVERAETVPTLVLRETCGGGGGGRRERRRDHLHTDGGIAVLVVRLMTVLDVVVTLRVLLRRDVASEHAESEVSTTP